MSHLSEEVLDLYALGRFFEGTAAVEAHLGVCQTCRDRLSAAAHFADRVRAAPKPEGGAERRRSPRFPTNDPAVVRCVYPVSDPWPVRVIDVSQTGMCLRTARFLEPGAEVKVVFGKLVAFGLIRYCLEVGVEYHAGVQLTQLVE